MMNERLIGTGVAVITPFLNSGEIDEKSLERIINHLINGGVEYLVFLGTTGESATLTPGEKELVKNIALEMVEGRVPVILGIGGNVTHEIIDSIKHTDLTGIDAILSVSPYYNKPTQTGLFYHYKAISEATDKPIILYNVPGRTSSNITADTTLKIAAELKNVIGIKEASGNFEQCMQIIKDKPKDFMVISGDDMFTLPFISMGMNGVISVTANAFPREFSDMVRYALRNDFEKATELHYSLLEIMKLMVAEGNPGGIKAMMSLKGLCENNLRLPLYKVSDSLIDKLRALA